MSLTTRYALVFAVALMLGMASLALAQAVAKEPPGPVTFSKA